MSQRSRSCDPAIPCVSDQNDAPEIADRRQRWEEYLQILLKSSSLVAPAAPSRYDFVKVRVVIPTDQVECPSYVLSRFLVSRLLMATQISSTHAVRIALDLKKRLVDSGLLTLSQQALERELFVLVRRWGYGPMHVQRYRMLSTWHQMRRPLLVLLAGTKGIGKSLLAAPLAERLNLSSVLKTEVVAELMRFMYPPSPSLWSFEFLSSKKYKKEQKKIAFNSSFRKLSGVTRPSSATGTQMPRVDSSITREFRSTIVFGSHPDDQDDGFDDDLDGFTEAYKQECNLVMNGISEDLTKCFKEGRSMLLVGPHISRPLLDLISNLQKEYPNSLVVSFLIAIEDQNIHRQWACIDPDCRDTRAFCRSRHLQEILLQDSSSQTVVPQNVNNIELTLDAMQSWVLQEMCAACK